jgi:TP901-1 family phage major tail protein
MSNAKDGASVLVLVPDPNSPGSYIPVAEQTNLSRESSRNLIEASSKDSDHTKWIYGKKDDTVELEALYVPNDAAMQALRNAQENKEIVVLRRTEDGTAVEQAEALVSTISDEFPDNDVSTVSVEFQLNTSWTPVSS